MVPKSADRQRHPLNDAIEIRRILVSGTPDEYEELRRHHDVSPLVLEKFREEELDREQAVRLYRQAITARELYGPDPTPEEIATGEYSNVPERAQINDHLRESDAVRFRNTAAKERTHVASRAEVDALIQQGLTEAYQTVESLDERQREALAVVEKLPISNRTDRGNLMLIIAGLKPATAFSNVGDGLESSAEEVAEMLRSCGLTAEVRPINGRDGGKPEIIVTGNPADMEALRKASGAKDHETFGRLMGFPPSAVRAFIEDTTLRTRPSDVSKDIAGGMALSPDNWPEEVHHLARWGYAVKLMRSMIEKDPTA